TAVLAPLAALPAWTSSLAPYAEGAALIGGAYAVNRAVRWALQKIAVKRGWEKNTVALWRFVSSLAVWGGAAGLGLSMAGVSGSVLAENLGVGGAAVALAVSLAVKDVAGNLFHGVHFLLSRPYTIGDKITVGKTTAVVRDLTLRYVVLAGEDGRDVLRTHASLAAAPVTLYGIYQTKELRLQLRKPVLPHGLLRALRDAVAAPSLWKPVVFTAAGIAALAFFPALGGFAAAKSLTWAAVILPYLKAGLVAFLSGSVSSTLGRSIGRLGERYAWNPAVVTVARLGATVLTWLVGGSFLLNAVGVSWPWVMKTLSIGGALVSIAVVDYGTAIFNAIVTFKLKPFEIGQENVSIGEHTGTVVDITWQNVVLKLDGDRYIIIPHSVVKDAEIKNPNKYGQRAEQ
ncbi:MAG: mechanosensitive ion channel, partial [Elusimicrobiota bacterium]|nr:mechanosensitive ion channel [Elusimicrobiota bacterium]